MVAANIRHFLRMTFFKSDPTANVDHAGAILSILLRARLDRHGHSRALSATAERVHVGGTRFKWRDIREPRKPNSVVRVANSRTSMGAVSALSAVAKFLEHPGNLSNTALLSAVVASSEFLIEGLLGELRSVVEPRRQCKKERQQEYL
jgi:hypothetical protein